MSTESYIVHRLSWPARGSGVRYLLCLFTSLCAPLFPVEAQTISTLAGTGTAGFSGDTGTPTSAQLNLPSSVFGDTLGNLYIADTGNHRIRSMPAARSSSRIAPTV